MVGWCPGLSFLPHYGKGGGWSHFQVGLQSPILQPQAFPLGESRPQAGLAPLSPSPLRGHDALPLSGCLVEVAALLGLAGSWLPPALNGGMRFLETGRHPVLPAGVWGCAVWCGS